MLTDFNVKYEPSVIILENEDKLAKFIEDTVAKYDSLVFTEDNIAEAKTSRKELNNLFKALDEGRKDVKKKYSEPLTNFEKTIKKYSGPIKTISEKIGMQIDEYDERERRFRQSLVWQVINEKASEAEVDTQKIAFKDNWTNKGAFTSNNNLTKKTLEEIDGEISLLVKEKARIAADTSVVINLAIAYGLEPDGWAQFVVDGQSAAELMPKMEQAAADKKARLEAEEQRKKAHEEYEQAMRQLELDKQQQAGDKMIDPDTGEVVGEAPQPQEAAYVNRPVVSKVVLELMGTSEQFQALNQYMIANGINVRRVG